MAAFSINTSLGQLVTARLSRSRVLERFGLDYCCGGKLTLREACSRRGLPVETVAQELEASDAKMTLQDLVDWSSVSMPDLIEDIVSIHHPYLRDELPRLSRLLHKVVRVHVGSHPELLKIWRIHEILRTELEMHMVKEENILFPMCIQLETAETAPRFHCRTIRFPLRLMEREHNVAEAALQKLRRMTNDYTPLPGACPIYHAWMHEMEALEYDLHLHIHKENNLLFPKALEHERVPSSKFKVQS